MSDQSSCTSISDLDSFINSTGNLQDTRQSLQLQQQQQQQELGQPLVQSPTSSHGQDKVLRIPGYFDVLFGRGKPFQEHPGNVRMQTIVQRNRHIYQSVKKSYKPAIAKEVIAEIRNFHTPIRFLKQSGHNKQGRDMLEGPWYETTEEEVYKKITHCLRSKQKATSSLTGIIAQQEKNLASAVAIKNARMEAGAMKRAAQNRVLNVGTMHLPPNNPPNNQLGQLKHGGHVACSHSSIQNVTTSSSEIMRPFNIQQHPVQSFPAASHLSSMSGHVYDQKQKGSVEPLDSASRNPDFAFRNPERPDHTINYESLSQGHHLQNIQQSHQQEMLSHTGVNPYLNIPTPKPSVSGSLSNGDTDGIEMNPSLFGIQSSTSHISQSDVQRYNQSDLDPLPIKDGAAGMDPLQSKRLPTSDSQSMTNKSMVEMQNVGLDAQPFNSHISPTYRQAFQRSGVVPQHPEGVTGANLKKAPAKSYKKDPTKTNDLSKDHILKP